jgi:hypothetical protein
VGLSAVTDRIVRLLGRIGLGPERLARPATSAGYDLAYQPVHPPIALEPVAPCYVHDGHPSTARYLHDHATWGNRRTTPAGIVTVHDADVSMPTGIHRWRGRPLREGFVGVEALRNPKYLTAFAAMLVLGSIEISEGVLLALPWNHNFFHWLVELLPRLQMVEAAPELQEAPLLVPATAPPFLMESLRLTGHASRAQQLDDGVYRVGSLHIPAPLSTTADISPIAMEWLDANFPFTPCADRRIYISRGDAPIRYVADEDQVSALLEREFGFETVVMSKLPLAEQVRTFREASVIVGSHGAAFAHLAFAPRGAAVLELFQDGHFNHCYGRMASLRDLRYGFLVCDRQGLGLRVDQDALRRLVGRMIADTGGRSPGAAATASTAAS